MLKNAFQNIVKLQHPSPHVSQYVINLMNQ